MTVLSIGSAVTFNKVDAFRIEVDSRRFPVQAMQFMKETGLEGNMLVFFDWAEYMIWHGGPASRVFMDGRFTDAYRVETVNDYLDFLYVRTPDWARALSKYPVEILLLHAGNDATREMRQRPDWAVVYEDELAVVFVRAGAVRPDVSRVAGPPPVSFFP